MLWKSRKNLSIIGDSMMRTRTVHGEKCRQLVLPKKIQQVALNHVHDKMGHLGRDRSLELLRARYLWVGMNKSVVDHITHLRRCIRSKELHPPKLLWLVLRKVGQHHTIRWEMDWLKGSTLPC